MGGCRRARLSGRDRDESTDRAPVSVPRTTPTTQTVAGVLELQRTIGNRAVLRMATGTVQRKLSVGPADDHFEREADRVAEEVMRDLSAVVPGHDPPQVRRTPADSTIGLAGGPLAGETEQVLQDQRGGGFPLPRTLHQSMGGALGADLSGVRLHTGSAADLLNRSMQSRAFTVGGDIFFARGQYQPQSSAGQRLLAHELTHTVQQGASVRRQAATRGATPLGAAGRVQRVFAPEFFIDATVRHHFPNGGAGYQTSQVAQKMRMEVQENGAGGQDTGYGFKMKNLYHKSSGVPSGTSVSVIFTVHPTYVVAMGEHATDTSYRLYWVNPNVSHWAVGNVVGLNNGARIDVASKADMRAVLNQQGYAADIQRNGGQLGWAGGGPLQGNQFTVEKTAYCGPAGVTLYALKGPGVKGIWERTNNQQDTILANNFKKG